MPILNKKEQNIIHNKIERKKELTLEEISDLQETLNKEQGFGQSRYQEVIEEDNSITWEYID